MVSAKQLTVVHVCTAEPGWSAWVKEYCLPRQVLPTTTPILETVDRIRLQRLAAAIEIAVTPVDLSSMSLLSKSS